MSQMSANYAWATFAVHLASLTLIRNDPQSKVIASFQFPSFSAVEHQAETGLQDFWERPQGPTYYGAQPRRAGNAPQARTTTPGPTSGRQATSREPSSGALAVTEIGHARAAVFCFRRFQAHRQRHPQYTRWGTNPNAPPPFCENQCMNLQEQTIRGVMRFYRKATTHTYCVCSLIHKTFRIFDGNIVPE